MCGKEVESSRSPIYGPFELSHFAEDSILNTRLNRFQEHHCTNEKFRAIVLHFLSRNRVIVTYTLKIYTKSFLSQYRQNVYLFPEQACQRNVLERYQ